MGRATFEAGPATHKCPHPQCEVEIENGHLACPPHWYQLPNPLRREIWKAYRFGSVAEHNAKVSEALEYWNG